MGDFGRLQFSRSKDWHGGPHARSEIPCSATPRKDRPATFDLPAIKDAAEAASATGAILSGVASGQITPGEAAEVAKLVETFVMAFETAD
ncbi:hypothetical protein XI01_04685 [Bradyrhizobium sp. CCBAU 21360]|nr:hypothetical protein [Bradyrhizobium sp. CCBAU 21360]